MPHKNVERIDKPTPSGGAYYVIYTHADDTQEIAEFTDRGKELHRYPTEKGKLRVPEQGKPAQGASSPIKPIPTPKPESPLDLKA